MVDPIPGAIVGAALTALIALGVWALAYYGDINLHLPTRPSPLSYQGIDSYIRSNLPSDYEFSTDEIVNFRGTGNPTIIVWANPRKLPFFVLKYSHVGGTLLFLDQDADGTFRIDYRFELRAPIEYPETLGTPGQDDVNVPHYYFLDRPVLADLVGDGRQEVIAQWTPLTAAGLNPFIGLIFGVQEGAITVEPLDANPLSDPASKLPSYVEAYKPEAISNDFDRSEHWSVEPYRLLGLGNNNGTLYALYRTDQACDFCDHSFLAQPYVHDPLGGSEFVTPDFPTLQFDSLELAQSKMQIIGSEVPTG